MLHSLPLPLPPKEQENPPEHIFDKKTLLMRLMSWFFKRLRRFGITMEALLLGWDVSMPPIKISSKNIPSSGRIHSCKLEAQYCNCWLQRVQIKETHWYSSLFSPFPTPYRNAGLFIADFTQHKNKIRVWDAPNCGTWNAVEFSQKVESGLIALQILLLCLLPCVLAWNKHYLVLVKSPGVESVSWLNLIERAEENLSKKNKFLVEQPTECVTWITSGGMGVVQKGGFDLALGNMDEMGG